MGLNQSPREERLMNRKFQRQAPWGSLHLMPASLPRVLQYLLLSLTLFVFSSSNSTHTEPHNIKRRPPPLIDRISLQAQLILEKYIQTTLLSDR